MSIDSNPLHSIKTFPQLVKYLRDELDWPIESENFEDLTFDYASEELGLDAATAVKIKEIKQLRPLTNKQPWGIFFVNFAPKQLPVVALRRILSSLVIKKRQSANKSQQAAWRLHDLLFISSYGETEHRDITFAHFAEEQGTGDLPTLRLLGWDDEDTKLKVDFVERELRTKLRWPEDDNNVADWRAKWSTAFRLRPREVIKTSQQLAIRLADLARGIRKRANNVLAVESAKGPLRKMHAAFREALIHDLTTDDFADMYAQTIAYGLLTARISRPAGLVADNLSDMVPVTNPFLKDLLETFLTIGGRKGKIDFDELGINDVVQLLRDTDMEAVLRDFGDHNPQEDPVIHFYELFLKEYDAKKRMQRGVFYTPRPVVQFIVRSVHEVLKKEFGLQDGLADLTSWAEMARRNKDLTIPQGVSPTDPFVQILDPATGTGTFLVEVIEVIHTTMERRWGKQGHMALEFQNLWNEYVPKYLLPRLHGYELLMAPYAIAHMKIGLKLYETGYHFRSDERARIFLTNALEPATDDKKQREFEALAPALAHEAQAVNAVKRKNNFTVVIGNPPYSAASHNPSVDADGKLTHIGKLMRRYFEIEGVSLGEKNPRWLQDDYVKFLRLAESHIQRTTMGVVGMITNHGYFANPTFRGMRYSLLQTFTSASLLDLHGNSKRGEKAPGGGAEENVFDIQQGVAISIWAKNSALTINQPPARIMRADLWGTRERKYRDLLAKEAATVEWRQLHPVAEFYLFVDQDVDIRNEYDEYWSLPQAFPIYNTGIITKRDALTIRWSRDDVWHTVSRFASLKPNEARVEFDLPEDVRDWKVEWAQRDLRKTGLDRSHIQPITYRPFDTRFIYYTGNARGFVGWPVEKVMRHLLVGKNYGLISARSNKSEEMDHFFITRNIMETKCGERTTQSCVFPLFLITERDLMHSRRVRRPNVQERLIIDLEERLEAKWLSEKGSESAGFDALEILAYTYAVFYSPSYRQRYAEFLRIDFPRLPLPRSLELFRALGCLGSELIAMHLLESPRLDKPISEYVGPKNPGVEKASYARHTVWLDKEQTCGFKGVPEPVWGFHIGGYQVCEKWLKDRKGRTLLNDDITHYNKIVVALSETIRLMKKIDEVIDEHGGWPGAFASGQQTTN